MEYIKHRFFYASLKYTLKVSFLSICAYIFYLINYWSTLINDQSFLFQENFFSSKILIQSCSCAVITQKLIILENYYQVKHLCLRICLSVGLVNGMFLGYHFERFVDCHIDVPLYLSYNVISGQEINRKYTKGIIL